MAALSDVAVSRVTPGQTAPRGRSRPQGAMAAALDAAGVGHATVIVRYLEAAPIRVQGPVTGRLYEFSSQQSLQAVERGDADAMTRTRFFRRTS